MSFQHVVCEIFIKKLPPLKYYSFGYDGRNIPSCVKPKFLTNSDKNKK